MAGFDSSIGGSFIKTLGYLDDRERRQRLDEQALIQRQEDNEYRQSRATAQDKQWEIGNTRQDALRAEQAETHKRTEDLANNTRQAGEFTNIAGNGEFGFDLDKALSTPEGHQAMVDYANRNYKDEVESGTPGRRVTGFRKIYMRDANGKALTDQPGRYVPIMFNPKTNSEGPATENQSTDPKDKVISYSSDEANDLMVRAQAQAQTYGGNNQQALGANQRIIDEKKTADDLVLGRQRELADHNSARDLKEAKQLADHNSARELKEAEQLALNTPRDAVGFAKNFNTLIDAWGGFEKKVPNGKGGFDTVADKNAQAAVRQMGIAWANNYIGEKAPTMQQLSTVSALTSVTSELLRQGINVKSFGPAEQLIRDGTGVETVQTLIKDHFPLFMQAIGQEGRSSKDIATFFKLMKHNGLEPDMKDAEIKAVFDKAVAQVNGTLDAEEKPKLGSAQASPVSDYVSALLSAPGKAARAVGLTEKNLFPNKGKSPEELGRLYDY